MTDIATIDWFGRGGHLFSQKRLYSQNNFYYCIFDISSGWPYDGLQVQQNSSDVKEREA